ncbi:MAG: hypothetical protein CFH19_01058 [Alphaproteobacteria bacterium MarineAlpha5_Bin9]|nr:MAG: hypothetical protein CFH19_01058 [Alphaproteobacteria bacterium MarineAlpha5_Bin9]|tara:strand:- start:4073 stop:4492 length:420 start_codon:yes stop_codon:yes gene_type:complete
MRMENSAVNGKEILEKNLNQIDFHISAISKQTIRNETVNWFQQSPLHWLFILFVMKYYYKNEPLSKQSLLEEINEHLATDGKKTVTTEFKYIDDAIAKEFIFAEISKVDQRKKNIYPTQKTVESLNQWFLNFATHFNSK